MTIKEMIQHAYYDLLSLKVNWFNGIMLALIVLVASSITTPFIGAGRLTWRWLYFEKIRRKQTLELKSSK